MTGWAHNHRDLFAFKIETINGAIIAQLQQIISTCVYLKKIEFQEGSQH